MPDLPSGTVTFLFTDIEGSTALWERDQAAMATAVARHLTLLRAAIEAHDGVLFKVVGDAVQAAFPTAPDAVAAALDAQRALVQRVVARERRTRAGADGAAYRCRDTAGRGLPRSRAEPPGPPAGCRPRRAGAPLPGHAGSGPGRAPGRSRPARPGRASPARSLPTRAGLPTAPSRSAGRLPADPDAGHPPQQPALATDPLSRAGGSGRPGR